MPKFEGRVEISHVVHAAPKMRARGGRVGSFEPRPEPSGLRTDPKLQLRGSDKHGFGYVILCNFAFVSLDQLGTEQCASIYLNRCICFFSGLGTARRQQSF